MIHFPGRYTCAAAAVLALCACGPKAGPISQAIAEQFEASGKNSVDLARAVPREWDKVCVLGPYSNNAAGRDTLGFDWNVEGNSSITSNEGISLLLFVRGDQVLHHAEHPRRHGDFSNLTGQCFDRATAKFAQNRRPRTGWPGLFHHDATTLRD